MTTQEKNKVILSVIVGFIATLVLTIIDSHEYGRGAIAWSQFICDNGMHFVGSTIIAYGALTLWQWMGNSMWDVKYHFHKFCKDMQD